jgi:manganese-dependent inorganic pyrophosphatase
MFPSGLFGIGQLEMPDMIEIEPKIQEIVKKLKEMPKYHSMMIMLTDVIKEGTKLIVVSKDEAKIAKAFKTKIKNNVSEFIPGMLSRKKQVAPVLTDNF